MATSNKPDKQKSTWSIKVRKQCAAWMAAFKRAGSDTSATCAHSVVLPSPHDWAASGSGEALSDPEAPTATSNAAISEAITLEMLADLFKFSRRIVERVRLLPDSTERKAILEIRIPSADDLQRILLVDREKLEALRSIQVRIPVSYRVKSELISHSELVSSHKPCSFLNYGEGLAETAAALELADSVGAVMGADSSYARLAERMRSVSIRYYVLYATVSAALGDTVVIETTTYMARNESATDGFASLRTAWGWRQNRHVLRTELPNATASYHLHFEVPVGFYLKGSSVRKLAHGHRAPVEESTRSHPGAPEGHVYIRHSDPIDNAVSEHSQYEMTFDFFERPPGSVGYAAVVGSITLAITGFILVALGQGWLIVDNKVQLTSAAALIAGVPAIVATFVPHRLDPSSPMKPALSARLSVYASTALSIFVAFSLATQGLGIDLVGLKGQNLWLPTLIAALSITACWTMIGAIFIYLWRLVKHSPSRFLRVAFNVAFIVLALVPGLVVFDWVGAMVPSQLASDPQSAFLLRVALLVLLPLVFILWARTVWVYIKSILIISLAGKSN